MTAVFVCLVKVEENKQVISYITRLNMVREQDFILTGSFETWNDPRLAFDPEVIGRSSVLLPPNSIWIPTVDMFNSLDNKGQHEQVAAATIEVRQDGHASILWYTSVDVVCSVDVGKMLYF